MGGGGYNIPYLLTAEQRNDRGEGICIYLNMPVMWELLYGNGNLGYVYGCRLDKIIYFVIKKMDGNVLLSMASEPSNVGCL